MSVLQKVLEQLGQRKSDRAKNYSQLVADIAAGQVPDAEALEAALLAGGKSESDLAADVDALQKRRAMQSQLAELQELAAKIPSLEKKVEKLVAEREAARAAVQAKIEPLYWELQNTREQCHRIDDLRRQLQEGCRDEVLLAAMRKAEQATTAARQAETQAHAAWQNALNRVRAAERDAHAEVDRRRGAIPSSAAEARQAAQSDLPKHARGKVAELHEVAAGAERAYHEAKAETARCEQAERDAREALVSG